MIDPRARIIAKRLSKIRKILAVSSGKGGVGKSVIASSLALALSKRGYKVGLLDVDFTCPSTHIILNVSPLHPKENKGIIPPLFHHIKYMSIIYYSGDTPTPLRGLDISNALIEILAVTRWGHLDFLLIDMPPGIGDITLDIIRLIKRTNFLIVTTSSRITFNTVSKLTKLLCEQKIRILGIIENMKRGNSTFIKERVKKYNIPFLGEIAFDPNLEDAIGDVKKLLETNFMKTVEKKVIGLLLLI